MTAPVAVLLAAGASRRFGRLKQLEPVGPDGEALLDYSVCDALRAGFGSIVVVVRPEIARAVRDHFDTRWAGAPLAFAEQTLEPGASRREKPWGTGHAVLAAAPYITGSFAVANADDFYGLSAWHAAAGWLSASTDPAEAAVIVYPIEATLSEHGGVSRALCQTASNGDVLAVTELLDVRRTGSAIEGRPANGGGVLVPPETPVSMNLWAFHVSMLPLLAERFARFVGMGPGEDDEFRLSTEIDALRHDGRVRVRAVRAAATWFGVTYAEDGPIVRSRIARLVEEGAYPARLGEAHLGNGG